MGDLFREFHQSSPRPSNESRHFATHQPVARFIASTREDVLNAFAFRAMSRELTPLSEVENVPSLAARARASARKPFAPATARRDVARALTSSDADIDVDVEHIIDAFQRAVDEECEEIVKVAEEECDKVNAEFNAKMRSMPKKLKTAPATEFAEALANDGGEEAMEELARVNAYLESIDVRLVRARVDVKESVEVGESVAEGAENGAVREPKPASEEPKVSETRSIAAEARGKVEKLHGQVSALVMRLLHK